MEKFFASGTVTFDFVATMKVGSMEEFMRLVQETFGEEVIVSGLETKYTKEVSVHGVDIEWTGFEKEEE